MVLTVNGKAAFHAIDTYAAVAKNRADAGAVATMAEHMCRQLAAEDRSISRRAR